MGLPKQLIGLGLLLGGLPIAAAFGQTTPPVRITVNSPNDGPIQADDALTLREAIEIANGTLPVTELSAAEQGQLAPSLDNQTWVGFDLPAEQVTIYLQDLLPPLTASNLIIDGTSQPGYGATRPELPNIP
ncbi:MAG: CSLREA domain-containing protein, partial [Cyanobacteria bacterium]|nr:CSLREA domain-containing protein [Cyanobacteriota bacterium]